MAGTVTFTASPLADTLLADTLLASGAAEFLGGLERRFRSRRADLLEDRAERHTSFRAGQRPDFLDHTTAVRNGAWQVAPPPKDLLDRRVEVVGPVDRATLTAGLSSGANVVMADFEDATSPTWANIVQGHQNVRDVLGHRLGLDGSDPTGTPAVVVRPRGWHLDERHVLVDGTPMSAGLFDVGVAMFHGARSALEHGSGPYFSLPKLETHLEARLWNDVFCHAQDQLGIDRGSVKAVVMIETITAVFEMDEILYELREHGAGLATGRWDYLASVIRCLGHDPDYILPERFDLGRTTPFLQAAADLLLATAHRRGAHAIGPISAFVPDAADRAVTESRQEATATAKGQEAQDGFDGSRIAHPAMVAVTHAAFDDVLGNRANQLERQRQDVQIQASDLLAVGSRPPAITEAGLRRNIAFTLRYLASWLEGNGTTVGAGLCEGAATAEISRAQIWQWISHQCTTTDGAVIDQSRVARLADEEATALRGEYPADTVTAARRVFDQLTLGPDIDELLTSVAYPHLISNPA
ncbi:MAG: malate synthase [Acidimicrobiales bacterium]